MKNLLIRRETEKDYRTVENLTREAFWNVYKPGCDEHYFVHCMRSHPDFLPELAFVMEKDGEIIGNIMFTRTKLCSTDGVEKDIVSFGPVSIAPSCQRQGYSRLLIEHSFVHVRKLGYDTVVNFGNPANYVGRGFVSCRKRNVCICTGVYPTALLVCELVPGVLEGRTWQYFPSEADLCCEDTAAMEAFDASFPPKEKEWCPSQEEFFIYSHSAVVR